MLGMNVFIKLYTLSTPFQVRRDCNVLTFNAATARAKNKNGDKSSTRCLRHE